MKYSKLIYPAILLFAASLFSCKKQFDKMVVENTALGDKAFLKVYNGTISSQRTNVFVDQVPVTGTSLAYNLVFPSTGYASALNPGQRTILIRDTVATSVQPQISFQATLAAGKNYSVYTYDTVNSIKYLFTEDQFDVPTDTSSRLRFVNLIFSKTALPNVDVFSVKRNANIFTNIPVGQATPFIPFGSKSPDTLYVRATGTTTNLTTLFTITPTPQRVYSVVYRGRYQTTTGTVMPRGLMTVPNY